jgi:hypothetical protein
MQQAETAIVSVKMDCPRVGSLFYTLRMYKFSAEKRIRRSGKF